MPLYNGLTLSTALTNTVAFKTRDHFRVRINCQNNNLLLNKYLYRKVAKKSVQLMILFTVLSKDI